MASFEEATAGDKLKPWLKGLFEIMFYGDKHAALRDACVNRALQMPDANLRSLYTNMMRWDAIKGDPVMRAINIPTLVIQTTTRGTDGIRRALNEGEMGHYPEVVKARNKHAEFALLAGHGHFTGLEAPEWTNDAIAAWVKKNNLA
jgi:pimeloyl-ACP methyl ester carboxylesterase